MGWKLAISTESRQKWQVHVEKSLWKSSESALCEFLLGLLRSLTISVFFIIFLYVRVNNVILLLGLSKLTRQLKLF